MTKKVPVSFPRPTWSGFIQRVRLGERGLTGLLLTLRFFFPSSPCSAVLLRRALPCPCNVHTLFRLGCTFRGPFAPAAWSLLVPCKWHTFSHSHHPFQNRWRTAWLFRDAGALFRHYTSVWGWVRVPAWWAALSVFGSVVSFSRGDVLRTSYLTIRLGLESCHTFCVFVDQRAHHRLVWALPPCYTH